MTEAALIPLAHAGHWLESVLIATPPVLLAAGLGVLAILERRRRRGER